MFRSTRKPSSGSHNHHLAKIRHLVHSGYVELVQDVVSVMATYCDLLGVFEGSQTSAVCVSHMNYGG